MVVMVTEERTFVVGKCSARSFPQYNGARYEYAFLSETSEFRREDTGSARHETRSCEVREIIHPDTRVFVFALQVDRIDYAYDLPNYLPNLDLTQEMIEAWRETVHQETENLHAIINRLEGRIEELLYKPKNTLGSSVKPQRRINIGDMLY